MICAKSRLLVGLLSLASTNFQKYQALQLMHAIIERLDVQSQACQERGEASSEQDSKSLSAILRAIFSENALRTLVNHLSDRTRSLHKAAQAVVGRSSAREL